MTPGLLRLGTLRKSVEHRIIKSLFWVSSVSLAVFIWVGNFRSGGSDSHGGRKIAMTLWHLHQLFTNIGIFSQ